MLTELFVLYVFVEISLQNVLDLVRCSISHIAKTTVQTVCTEFSIKLKDYICIFYYGVTSMFSQGSYVTASFKYSIGVRVTMHIDWDWLDTEVTRAGLTFSGSLSATVTGGFVYSKEVGRARKSKTYSKVSLFNYILIL